jgi:hypothetical protein
MFLVVHSRARTVAALTALAFAAPAVPALARGGGHSPTAAQIRTAISTAQNSKLLWATVNICDTKQHPNTIGIRAQMPSLPFAASLSVKVQVDYWSTAADRFLPDPGVSRSVPLGDQANQITQGGANFRFQPPVVLSGTVTFAWKLGSKTIGHATRLTGHGYKGVQAGDPVGYSTATCRMN